MQEDGSWTVKEPVSSVLEPGTPAAETVREALEGNPYVTGVSNVSTQFDGTAGKLSISCKIETIYGTEEVTWDV